MGGVRLPDGLGGGCFTVFFRGISDAFWVGYWVDLVSMVF